jgi:hypothetical protein
MGKVATVKAKEEIQKVRVVLDEIESLLDEGTYTSFRAAYWKTTDLPDGIDSRLKNAIATETGCFL